MKLRFFNMIEVLLALGITAVGITGLMGIIPLGLNANRDAMAETFTADIANSYFARLTRNAATASDFSTFCTSVANIPFPVASKESVTTPDSNTVNVYKNPISDLTAAQKASMIRLPAEYTFTESGVDMESASVGGKSYFKIRVGKEGANFPDFEADLCGWKCYPDDIPDVVNANEDGKRNLIRVYLEISWPVTAAYDNREKRIFIREFYDKKGLVEEAP